MPNSTACPNDAHPTQILHLQINSRILMDEPLDAVLHLACQELVRLYGFDRVAVGLSQADGAMRIAAEACRRAAGAAPGWDRDAWPVLTLPLRARVAAVGELVVQGPGSSAVDPDREHLRVFADHLALTVIMARRQEQLRLQTAALEAAANTVVITDRDGRIEWVNPAFTRLTGYGPDEVRGQNPRLLKSGRHGADFYRELWGTIKAGRTWTGEIWNRRKDGSLYLCEQSITPVYGSDGEIAYFVTIQQDATRRKQHEEELDHMARHDFLTGLANRRSFDDTLRLVVQRAGRGRPAALFMLDIDSFKLINDSIGHPGGDQLLVAVARLLCGAVRDGDLVARLGGDEFAVLAEDLDADGARSLAERLRSAVDEFRFAWGSETLTVSTSIGVATIDGHLTPDAVLTMADDALYEAKAAGKNCVAVHQGEQAGAQGPDGSHRLMTAIKDALREDRFQLLFQPVVDLTSARPAYFEVLLRMLDDDGRVVLPDTFIPVAERSGLMARIDRWVVGQALAVLQSRPDLRLFVNLSAVSLASEDAARAIVEMVRSAGIAPGRLGFEITETAAVADIMTARRCLQRLRSLGCPTALDDFGKGFSSLAYLRMLPVDYVKLDGSLIADLESNAETFALAKATTELVRALGKKVTAEWVERESAVKVLRELGVDYGQGHLWGMPSAAIP